MATTASEPPLPSQPLRSVGMDNKAHISAFKRFLNSLRFHKHANIPQETPALTPTHPAGSNPKRSLPRTMSAGVGVAVRPTRLGRQESEMRERLTEYPTSTTERRISTAQRRTMFDPRATGTSVNDLRSQSASELTREQDEDAASLAQASAPSRRPTQDYLTGNRTITSVPEDPLALGTEQTNNTVGTVKSAAEVELDWKWILNLSMHFRDQSDREKFFVTYAETPQRRRRLTVSCDYRDAQPGTLEKELSRLQFQRDKSAKIYEAIRDSLPSIQFYDTITNLKLVTNEGRLHVHVTEDLHEIIVYPPVSAVRHLKCRMVRESDLQFDAHLSGFVYKVLLGDQVYIKKEIPGPDTVDEFLYEINALHALRESQGVVGFGGCVTDESGQKVKGLLVEFAAKGSLIDIIYNAVATPAASPTISPNQTSTGPFVPPNEPLALSRRLKWAKQIAIGIGEIHEAGFVQGDLTLSNIVIDANDDAKIIDINRRGCPVGWEPPEISALVEGFHRIAMYIGTKSDVFQLGMVLWAIAAQNDEPEAEGRPLRLPDEALPLRGDVPLPAGEWVPEWYRRVTHLCLSEKPQDRPSAKDIAGYFPADLDMSKPESLKDQIILEDINDPVVDGEEICVVSINSHESPNAMAEPPVTNGITAHDDQEDPWAHERNGIIIEPLSDTHSPQPTAAAIEPSTINTFANMPPPSAPFPRPAMLDSPVEPDDPAREAAARAWKHFNNAPPTPPSSTHTSPATTFYQKGSGANGAASPVSTFYHRDSTAEQARSPLSEIDEHPVT